MKHPSSLSISRPDVSTPLRILIADDFPEWRTQIRKILRSRPEWEVIGEASDGKQALGKAVELQPHVVLLDIGMPVLNGIQACLRIRQHCPATQIIFVTQTNDEIIREAALEMGASGYVLKSDVATDLIPAIAAALSNHNGHRSTAGWSLSAGTVPR